MSTTLSTMKRSATLLASGLIAGAMLVGCSPAVTGGDTTCKDFTGADDKTQNDAVSKMLKDEKGTDAAQGEITATKLAVSTWCGTLGKPDSKIKEAPHL
jgi:acid stress chaperone HdeA